MERRRVRTDGTGAQTPHARGAHHDGDQHRAARARADLAGAGGRVRDHIGGHPPIGPELTSGVASTCTGRPGGTHRRRPMGDRHARVRRSSRPLDAGADRRARRLLAALRRHILGSAGRLRRGHRAHRGDPWPGRHVVGRQRGERHHQHHHQIRARHAGSVCPGQHRNERLRPWRVQIRHHARAERLPARIREGLDDGAAVSCRRDELRRPPARPGRIPRRLDVAPRADTHCAGRPVYEPTRRAIDHDDLHAAVFDGHCRGRAAQWRQRAGATRRPVRHRRHVSASDLLRPHRSRRTSSGRDTRHLRRRLPAASPAAPATCAHVGRRLPCDIRTHHGPRTDRVHSAHTHRQPVQRVRAGRPPASSGARLC